MSQNEERKKWDLEHTLWDFLQFVSDRYVLAEWHNEGDCKICGPGSPRHMIDQLRPQKGGFLARRNLPREFLGLETWQESEKKADLLLAELRENSKEA